LEAEGIGKKLKDKLPRRGERKKQKIVAVKWMSKTPNRRKICSMREKRGPTETRDVRGGGGWGDVPSQE